MDVEQPTPEVKSKKMRKESEKKVSSKSEKKDKREKKDKKDKKKQAEPVPEVANKKKRKASAAEATDGVSKKVPDLHPLKKIGEWLEMLSVPFDEAKLAKVKRTQERRYNVLVEVMTDPATKGIIFAYSVKTPLGRLFWYSYSDREFKSVREEYNLIKLHAYPKEASLKLIDIQNRLTETQRKTALDCVDLTESDIVSPETWLYALIETGVIAREAEKPLSTQAVEAVLFHDTEKRQTYWMGSDKGQERFHQVIVTRTRTIKENNIGNEYLLLAKKRKEIIQMLEELGCSAATIRTMSDGSTRQRTSKIAASKPDKAEKPKKNKKPDVTHADQEEEDADQDMEVEQPKKKKKEKKEKKKEKKPSKLEKTQPKAKKQKKEESVPQQPISPLLAMLPNLSALLASDSSSGSYSSSATSSSSEEEISVDTPPSKSRVAPYTPVKIDPNATHVAKSLEVKRNIEEALKHKKVMDDVADPEIRYFRTNCV